MRGVTAATALAALALLLAGPGPGGAGEVKLISRAWVTPPGPPAYKDGWRQGCAVGRDAAGWNHVYAIAQATDRHRLAADSDYRRGFDDAVDQCFETAISRPHDPGK